jgi:hypothetical protein
MGNSNSFLPGDTVKFNKKLIEIEKKESNMKNMKVFKVK